MGRRLSVFLAALFLCLSCQSLSAAAAPKTRVIVGTIAAAGSPWDKMWRDFRANIEAQDPNHEIDVKLLTRGEAGPESTAIGYIRRGRLHYSGGSLAGMAPVLPELSVLLVPFFYDDLEEVDYVMDHYMLDLFRELFAQKGLYLVNWVEAGWINVASKFPVLLPEDMTGHRMRVQASKAAEIFAGSLNADILQLEFADLVPSLQSGLVEGASTNMVIYSLTGVAKAAPHLTLTHHAYETGLIVANKQWLDQMPDAHRKIILNAYPGADQIRAMVRGLHAFLTTRAKEQGAQLHELSPEARRAWVAATEANHRKIIETVGGDAARVYAAMQAGRAEFRQRRRNNAVSEAE